MDNNNQPEIVSRPTTSTPTEQKQVVRAPKNYFWFAITIILFGAVLIVGIFLWAYPKNGSSETTTTTTATSSKQINSTVGLDKATLQLDNADLNSLQNGLTLNTQDAAKF